MKNSVKLLAIALAAVIGFTFAALSLTGCGNGGGGTGPVSKEVLDTIHSYRANGELFSYSESEYDSKGNMTKQSIYYAKET